MKTLTKSMVEFSIEVQPEMESIERALGFDQTGADHSEYINKVIKDDGMNVWLWSMVTVKAKFFGLVCEAHLGGCAYESEADFIAGGYYEQMQDEAFEGLKNLVETIVSKVSDSPSLLKENEELTGILSTTNKVLEATSAELIAVRKENENNHYNLLAEKALNAELLDFVKEVIEQDNKVVSANSHLSVFTIKKGMNLITKASKAE